MLITTVLAALLGSNAVDAAPIVIREPYLARVEDRTYNFACPNVKAHANFSRSNDEVFGSIRAMTDSGLVEYGRSQDAVFGQLSIVDDISVSCMQQRNAFAMLISGYSKDGGEEVILQLSYDSEAGFDEPHDILR